MKLHYPNMNKLLQQAFNAIKTFLKIEGLSTVGRFNLAFGVLLLIFAIIATVPNCGLELVRICMNRPSPAWTYIIPIACFVFLAFFLYLSLNLIAPRPRKQR